MILYLSSGTDQSLFEEYQNKGIVSCGFQAQRFNYLVISGIAHHRDVTSVANIPYASSSKKVAEKRIECERATFICIEKTKGKFHKLKNLLNMNRACKKTFTSSNVEGIVCDAINPLASLLALYYAKKKHIKAIAIVTDLPFYMDENHVSLFTKLTQFLLEKYDAYVLLTEAMNPIANPKKKPHIVMEGLCEVKDYTNTPVNKVNSFVYTGSLSYGTGIEEMMKGFVAANLEGIKLDIYGRGEMEDDIREFSVEHPQVRFMGAVNNSEVVIKQREALLLINPRPSGIGYGEFSFPSKVMEYMASGTPVLTTRLPGIPKEYFKYVFTVDNDSYLGFKDLFTQCAMLYENNEDIFFKKGNDAMQFVQQNKNISVQGERVINLMEGLLN